VLEEAEMNARCAAIVTLAIACTVPHNIAHGQSTTTNAAPDASRQKDAFALGPSLPVKPLDSNETIRWGVDFVLSPGTARDRLVLYAYDLAHVDAGFFESFEEQIVREKPKIAIVSGLSSRKNDPFANKAVPIFLDAKSLPTIENFISTISTPEMAQRFLPAALAVSGLKTNGVKLDAIPDFSKLSIDSTRSALIASSIPIPGPYQPLTYVASTAGWVEDPSGPAVTLPELVRAKQ
jgi:hypothetical protein